MQKIENDPVLAELKNRKIKLTKLINKTRKNMSEKPKGSLRVTKHGKSWQYYLITQKNDTNGKYLPKDRIETARAIAQRDYNEKLLSELQNELQFVNRTLNSYVPDKIDEVYDDLSDGRKILVTPVIPTNEQFICEWKNRKLKPNPFPEKPQFQTDSGIFVRSKSEVMIANCLSAAKIPFFYEYPLLLDSIKQIVYPDFFCLNPRTHQEFVWEHFGRMDDKEYSAKSVIKIAEYAENGYIHGKNLITTFEASGTPLTPQSIKRIIEEFLL